MLIPIIRNKNIDMALLFLHKNSIGFGKIVAITAIAHFGFVFLFLYVASFPNFYAHKCISAYEYLRGGSFLQPNVDFFV